jgi:hypothetical protein
MIGPFKGLELNLGPRVLNSKLKIGWVKIYCHVLGSVVMRDHHGWILAMVVDSMAGIKYPLNTQFSLFLSFLGPPFRSTFSPCESPNNTFDPDF